jgi:hypothetical protein
MKIKAPPREIRMNKDLRQQLETAASSLQDRDEEERVPKLVRIIANFTTFVTVIFFIFFGLNAGLFYANQGENAGANAPLLTGIGLFLGLMVGTIAGVGIRKLLYKLFSR